MLLLQCESPQFTCTHPRPDTERSLYRTHSEKSTDGEPAESSVRVVSNTSHGNLAMPEK